MLELKGKYNTAKIFTDNVEPKTVGQLINLLNQEFVRNCRDVDCILYLTITKKGECYGCF